MGRYFVDCLGSVSRERSDDLFYKYNHIIYRMTQTDPSNLPIYFFFQTKINARGCFEEDLVYPFAFPPFCPPFYRVFPRRHLPCQKLFPLEIYRFGENRGVISWRTKQRERVGRSRSSFEE